MSQPGRLTHRNRARVKVTTLTDLNALGLGNDTLRSVAEWIVAVENALGPFSIESWARSEAGEDGYETVTAFGLEVFPVSVHETD